jgi:hypothetical protein
VEIVLILFFEATEHVIRNKGVQRLLLQLVYHDLGSLVWTDCSRRLSRPGFSLTLRGQNLANDTILFLRDTVSCELRM